MTSSTVPTSPVTPRGSGRSRPTTWWRGCTASRSTESPFGGRAEDGAHTADRLVVRGLGATFAIGGARDNVVWFFDRCRWGQLSCLLPCLAVPITTIRTSTL